jgi:hypothetical protein
VLRPRPPVARTHRAGPTHGTRAPSYRWALVSSLSAATPHAATRRLTALRLTPPPASGAVVPGRVREGVVRRRGWHGMQEVRGSNPLSSTAHQARHPDGAEAAPLRGPPPSHEQMASGPVRSRIPPGAAVRCEQGPGSRPGTARTIRTSRVARVYLSPATDWVKPSLFLSVIMTRPAGGWDRARAPSKCRDI